MSAIKMVEILGNEIDLFSLIPAVIGLVLSIYNWLMMRKPADIIPNEIVEYGLISSEEHEGIKLILPLIFHNDSANPGLITQIKVGFKHGTETKYLKFVGRARLEELTEKTAFQGNWDSFEEGAYKIQQPTYPISVPGAESVDVVMIANSWDKDQIIPIDNNTTCVVEVSFGNKKKNKIEFPFILKKEHMIDNIICWYGTISSHPDE